MRSKVILPLKVCIVCVFLTVIIDQAIAGQKTKHSKKDSTMTVSKQTEQVIKQLINGESLSTAEIMKFGRLENGTEELIGTVKQLRLSSLDVIIDLGRPVIPEDKETTTPERPGQIVSHPVVIDYLVELLNDGDREIRSKACVALAQLVPSSLLQPHKKALLGAIQQHPSMDGALLLLGKTDSPEALEILDKNEALSSTSEDDVIMVRARLGDQKAEDALLRAYADITDPREKGALAPRLGYVASQNTKMLLAKEIRTPDFYYWNKQSRRSLRIYIIEALHLSFPQEPLFWKPFFTPSNDVYYEKIEKWLEEKLEIEWERPRPPFLYEEAAPSAPPPPRK